MPSSIPPTETVQEFGTAKGWRWFIYLLMPPLVLLFLAMPFIFWDAKAPLVLMLSISLLFIGMAGFFLYGLIETVKGKHIITADKLIYQGAFSRKEIPLDNIEGYRTDEHYIRVFPTDATHPKIRIGYTSENYKDLQQWFADYYPDLDAQEQEQADVAILQDDSLGATTEEREIRLSKARRTSKVLNIAGGAVAAWLLFQPDPYHWAVAAGLALPWLTAAALWLHPAALSLVENKNSAHPSPSLALLLPALALLLRGVVDFEILNYQNLWLPAAVVTIGLAGGLLTSTRHFVTQSDSRLSTLLTALGYAALYGFAATLIVNCAYDEGHATKHTARVLRKHVSSGKTTTYYLEVSSWGPRRTAADVMVSRDYYQQLQVGNEVRIHQMPGRLSVPWFTVLE